MFSCYRIYHVKDFTCILPVSIDSGKTHQKSPAHSSVFRGFFVKCVGQIFKACCTITSPHPHPVHDTNIPICLKSAKIYETVTKNCSRLSMCSTGIEKKSYMCHPGIEFLTPVATWSGQYTCLAAKIRFLLFKGPGSFKTIFKIGGNVDELKAYRLIPLTPPFFFILHYL